LLLASLAGLGLFRLSGSALAQSAAHPNTLRIIQEGTHTLVFQFSLNLPQVLHQLLSPAVAYAAFLQTHAAMPSGPWASALQKAQARLAANGVLTLPGGKPLRLQSWQWPDADVIAQSLRAQELLLHFPEASRPHLDPVLVPARLQTLQPIYQAQLQLPAALHPIEVTVKNDKFWLTNQISLARVNLQ
jgi:hypothetical protein